MQLVGSTFCCEVPDGWQETRQPGCVIATAPVPVLGFTPNVVLRESVIEERPDALAAICQANLRSTADFPGALVVQVEAFEQHDVEHRRIWMLIPAAPEELHGNILCLLSIQDLTITDGVIAELTVTLPLVEWSPGDVHQAIPDSLQAMPPAEQAAPPTTSPIPELTLDDWATARDGAPREDLSVVAPSALVLQAEPLVLTTHAVNAFFAHSGQRVFTPVTGQVKDELAAAGLVERDGLPSGAGYWYIDHLLSGVGWTITVAAPKPREFRFWVTDASTVFTTPNPEQEGTSLLAYCPSNDLFRVLLGWVEATPAWPMDVHLELSREQVQDKLEHGTSPISPYGRDSGEFLRHDWTHLALNRPSGEPALNWIHSSSRGDALLWLDTSLQNPDNLFTIRQVQENPLWMQLISIITQEK